jgi:thymidylate synthase
MKQYLDTVRTILRDGTRKESRTGVDTISTFNINYNIDLRNGFPLVTTKDVSWKNIAVENLWFLSGDPDIGLLQKHGCKFWNPWADEDGKVPSAYGNFWRHFPIHTYQLWGDGAEEYKKPLATTSDQIAWVLSELKRNPMSRRLIVSAWAPGNAQTSKLPPCHYTFVFNVQMLKIRCPHCHSTEAGKGKWCPTLGCAEGYVLEPHLCLHMTQRSCDTALGVPYNIAGYAFLLELFSHLSGIPAGIFGHTLIDAHIYTSKPDGSMSEYDHVPGLKEQLKREPRKLPNLFISSEVKDLADIEDIVRGASTEEILRLFNLTGYDPHPAIKFKVAV